MRGLVEFINKATGETFCVPVRSLGYLHSRDAEDDMQVTSIRFSGKELDIEGTYDEICQELKKAGYEIQSRIGYTKDRDVF